ncbi:MAG: DUF6680 family protein [Thermodesulfobacteriota bacterium]
MTKEQILITVVSSLSSGLLGVLISSWFYARFEKRKMKTETARKLFANRHDMHGPGFHEAMNEIMIVFSGNQKVINLIEDLFKTIETPRQARPDKAADEALIKLMKAICKDIGIEYKTLPDSYYLNFFSMPRQ